MSRNRYYVTADAYNSEYLYFQNVKKKMFKYKNGQQHLKIFIDIKNYG